MECTRHLSFCMGFELVDSSHSQFTTSAESELGDKSAFMHISLQKQNKTCQQKWFMRSTTEGWNGGHRDTETLNVKLFTLSEGTLPECESTSRKRSLVNYNSLSSHYSQHREGRRNARGVWNTLKDRTLNLLPLPKFMMYCDCAELS
jgi:hypothetical protein